MYFIADAQINIMPANKNLSPLLFINFNDSVSFDSKVRYQEKQTALIDTANANPILVSEVVSIFGLIKFLLITITKNTNPPIIIHMTAKIKHTIRNI